MRSLATELQEPLLRITDAIRSPEAGGVPPLPGVYAWWVAPEALPRVPAPPHASEPYSLLYIGIAPKRATSTATLRSRICNQHVGGNVGSSTFRRSLAALLAAEKRWVPVRTPTRERLSERDNLALSAWQRKHLRVTWVHAEGPWTIEDSIIEEMQPPLNLSGNSRHPFYDEMCDARRRFKRMAQAR